MWCHDDIIEVVTAAGRNLDTIVVPKACTARDVWWVDLLLTQLEAKLGLERKIRLEVLIEEVEGLANAEEIATASPRIDALIFGVGDFSLSQGARVDTNFVPLGDYPGDFWHYARNKVLVAARIAGIEAIDSPYPDYADLAGYETEARRSSLYGYTGKWAIHPDQIPVANAVFAPTADEIALAERNMAAYREGEAKGLGAVGVEGVLVDAAHVKMAQRTLDRVALINGGSPPERARNLEGMNTEVLDVDTSRRRTVDLTDQVRSFCAGHGDGLCNVFVPHATAGVAIIETGAAPTPTSSTPWSGCCHAMTATGTPTGRRGTGPTMSCRRSSRPPSRCRWRRRATARCLAVGGAGRPQPGQPATVGAAEFPQQRLNPHPLGVKAVPGRPVL